MVKRMKKHILRTIYPLPDSIGILLLKLVNVGVRLLGELPSEELERILKSQSDAFKEEAVLESRLVLDVVGCSEHLKRSIDMGNVFHVG